MSIIELPSGRFRLQIRRKSLSVDEIFDTEAEAKEAADDYLPAKPRKVRSHSGLTFKTAWGRYRVSLTFKTKKATTQRSEETHVKAALKRFGKWPVSSIEPQDVEAMILAALKKGKAPTRSAMPSRRSRPCCVFASIGRSCRAMSASAFRARKSNVSPDAWPRATKGAS